MDTFAADRHRMVVEQIARRGLHDPRLLEVLERVPRHVFVPEDDRFLAYEDAPLPIGFGQTISQPYIVALMTSALGLCGDEHVLEVGTGSGYQAAILAALVRDVHTVELIPQLAARAENSLCGLGFENVQVHCADGSLGWPDAAPYDRIVVTAASPGIPPPLLDQLSDQGRMILPVEHVHAYQLLKLLTRYGKAIHETVISSVCFVPLRGAYGRKPRERNPSQGAPII